MIFVMTTLPQQRGLFHCFLVASSPLPRRFACSSPVSRSGQCALIPLHSEETEVPTTSHPEEPTRLSGDLAVPSQLSSIRRRRIDLDHLDVAALANGSEIGKCFSVHNALQMSALPNGIPDTSNFQNRILNLCTGDKNNHSDLARRFMNADRFRHLLLSHRFQRSAPLSGFVPHALIPGITSPGSGSPSS